MKLIKLSCDCYVNPNDVQEITVNGNQHITVRMRDGVGHHVEHDYGRGVYVTVDRLRKEIEEATQE